MSVSSRMDHKPTNEGKRHMGKGQDEGGKENRRRKKDSISSS